jgi:hypothetical protein
VPFHGEKQINKEYTLPLYYAILFTFPFYISMDYTSLFCGPLFSDELKQFYFIKIIFDSFG